MKIPTEVVAAVRDHAVEVDAERPGFESMGALVLAGGRVERYVRVANVARGPFFGRHAGESLPRRRGGLPLVHLHSHPIGGAHPSEGDLRWAAHHGLDTVAIYGMDGNELRVWRVDPLAEVEFEIVT
jgi:proteasome lid subunit RPN8/RPN11